MIEKQKKENKYKKKRKQIKIFSSSILQKDKINIIKKKFLTAPKVEDKFYLLLLQKITS